VSQELQNRLRQLHFEAKALLKQREELSGKLESLMNGQQRLTEAFQALVDGLNRHDARTYDVLMAIRREIAENGEAGPA
jgi:predicted  nucleic acid-binding Zn-ribbon protein